MFKISSICFLEVCDDQNLHIKMSLSAWSLSSSSSLFSGFLSCSSSSKQESRLSENCFYNKKQYKESFASMAMAAVGGVTRIPSSNLITQKTSTRPTSPFLKPINQSLSSSSSDLSGDKIPLKSVLRSLKASFNARIPILVSPKAVSDSQGSQTCLDPDASRSVLGIILGGGAGTRLYPLTKKRAKPAVPLGANYRLIDIPVSNCLNSNISKIYVLTQFNSASLNRHLSRAYASNMGGYKNEGFVEVLAAQQSPENPNWFQGTADAVRQYLWLFEEHNVMEFLVLAGDHLYRMDYEKFIQAHRETDADITVAALPMDEKRATAFGLMKIDEEGRIIEFAEKPKGEQLKAMKVDTTILGLDDERAKEMPYIASMGIYVVSKDVMLQLLREKFPGANDFGSEVIPGATSIGMRVQAYLYDGYWEDIGTIEAFYNANLGITKKPIPDFSFYDRSSPIYTQPRYLPPSKMLDADVTDSVIGEGCVIKNCKIHHSVVGLRSCISEGAIIEDTLLMGADYYETDADRRFLAAKGSVPIGIGRNTHIKRAIIDKNARIGDDVKIINSDNVLEAARETDGYFIKSGIVTVIKDALIPSGTII
ncbi:PREDICTED: glucose-1-phosphate adenylyltransferase small subunit, chloroplastic/amyloplastic [Nelumbo nucifera]|uniref:Glucose-1-phosphate adenylyltransferase n=2 Tax=Nelumbo nucifera TaxID=4432 RepID=A0A1U7ZVD0_NELNU|nr:PREDICTED: glucose-1-phosphate adenylyltransferase small subunit, chloroplastic/amyloplastic [Nelumbo nucifera]